MASNGPDKYNYNIRPVPPPGPCPQPPLPPPPPPPTEATQRLAPHELANRMWRMEETKPGGSTVKVAASAASSSANSPGAMREVNQRVHGYASEVRDLKEVNRRYQEDNQELRDLCCFLDDDRQKGRKLAREWQRFGRYTASVMRQEVSTYQAKLRELESRQQELIKDNLELKELCLYLDEERVGSRGIQLCSNCNLAAQQGPRDEGDGSSSSTNNDEVPVHYLPFSFPVNGGGAGGSRERLLAEDSLQWQKGIMNEQALQYIRGLEKRIQQLEEEKTSRRSVGNVERPATKPLHPPPYRKPPCPPLDMARVGRTETVTNHGGKPEAVVHAMKVLEVHEQIEKTHSSDHDDLADGERALLREMCNVVWKKLEDGSNHS